MKIKILLVGMALWLGIHSPVFGQMIDPDSIELASVQLEKSRIRLRNQAQETELHILIRQMLDLGLWKEAKEKLNEVDSLDMRLVLLKARLAYLTYDFETSESLINPYLSSVKSPKGAILLQALLEMESWELDKAEQRCVQYLKTHPRDEEAIIILGKVYILKKSYPKALALAEQVIQWNPENAEAYALAGEVYFWMQELEKAEENLRKCLSINPFHADSRFSYGYAIWRRVDATQLPAMAAQWELALEIHPLHYRTHWHWGNGHTHLTYRDYVDPKESEIRRELTLADTLLSNNQMKEAHQQMAAVAKEFPNSVLPEMMRASAYYMSLGSNRDINLDSAQAIFLNILKRKPHYGPAHNGLAAVIKQRQVSYLSKYDSLESVIEATRIADPKSFYRVFSDVKQYPGNRVEKMIWNQLYTSVAYFPLLSKLKRKFVIPPLHQDLSLAMKNPWFRGATTFDNRQWMDIRGVGSGATGIEYVERGAHLERNVTLHEYVHLFHGQVFTDAEMREVRERYYYAMKNDCILDYYSANNEFEYLAQTFPAYFIPVKVHPLNHKSINTTADLKSKDPLMYDFIDRLVKKQRKTLAGDDSAFASNWAQTYVQLAQKSPSKQAFAYLDTALTWDSTYLPAYIEYSSEFREMGKSESAMEWLQKATSIDATYGPLYQAYAQLANSQFELGEIDLSQSIQLQKDRYDQAEQLETDLAVRASLNQDMREFYRDYSMIIEAMEQAEAYVMAAPTISTYLRDQREAAEAFAQELKGRMGYKEEPLAFFKKLIAQKPQQINYRLTYAQLLGIHGKYAEAIQLLTESQELFKAAGTPNAQLPLTMASIHLMAGNMQEAEALMESSNPGVLKKETRLIWANIWARIGKIDMARNVFQQITQPILPYELGDYRFTEGLINLSAKDSTAAISSFKLAIAANPYHLPARMRLLELLDAQGEIDQVKRIALKATVLPIPPGPVYEEKLSKYLE